MSPAHRNQLSALFLRPTFPQKDDPADDLVRRIRLNHPRAQLEEAGFGRLLRVEDGRLFHAHVPRGLGASLLGLLAKSLRQGSQIRIVQRFSGTHAPFRNIFILDTILS